MTDYNKVPELPRGYEAYLSQVTGKFSIWHTSKQGAKPEIMAEGFRAKEEAIEFLLFL